MARCGGGALEGEIPDRGCGSSQGWGFRQGMGFQSGVGFQTRHGVPDMEWGSRKGFDIRHKWCSRHVMMGCQTDDGVPGRGGETTLMSHQSRILHS